MSMELLSHPSQHRSWVEINVSAITGNTRRFKRLVPRDTAVMPAVKADAYGHGAIQAARAALAGGATRLAVATCQEGQSLRESGIGVPIQILGASLPEEVDAAVKFNLTPSLHNIEIAELFAVAAHSRQRVVPIHVKIDTGMGRLGILPQNAAAAAREIASLPNLHLEGVFMHFADPGDIDYSKEQIRRFNSACENLRRAGVAHFLKHAASAAGAVLHPDAHFDIIRPGSGIYGYLLPVGLAAGFPLEPAMAWRSAVIQIKDYPAGQNLGYCHTFTTRRPTRVAVLPVGYADGYRREFSNRAQVLIRGRRAPVVGMVSMDYSMVDVTELEEFEVGTVATLLGPDRGDCIGAGELAEWGCTIPYCITTGIGPRVGRLFVSEWK